LFLLSYKLKFSSES